jgi:hypothetical protein
MGEQGGVSYPQEHRALTVVQYQAKASLRRKWNHGVNRNFGTWWGLERQPNEASRMRTAFRRTDGNLSFLPRALRGIDQRA